MQIKTIVRPLGYLIGACVFAGAAFWLGTTTSPSPTPSNSTDAHDHEAEAAKVWTCTMHQSVRRSEPGLCPICNMDLVEVEASAIEEPEVWTCTMHQNVRRSEPGLCPICNMDLVKVEASAEGGGSDRRYVMTEAARKLMQIQTAVVERRFAMNEIRMTGKVGYDETTLSYITAWVPGRLDRMYVDFTGVQVNEGDHMVDLYSPELLTAEEELWRAAQMSAKLKSGTQETIRRTATTTLEAARRKLDLWGLTAKQISDIETNGVTSNFVTIFSPKGGTVVERKGQEGEYVNTGTHIYGIADLTHLWVLLDAYESDLMWLHYGQDVVFETEAYPGREFKGQIAFIDPVLDKKTRTVRVRVNVPNPERILKPEMFVRATVRAQVALDGRVMNPELAGKWIGPMHPEIVRDGPGVCPICGMDLKRVEDLGYVPASGANADKPLVIPATAPLVTGKRAVVYVEVPDQDQPTYEGREVVLGPRAGDSYIVHSGLSEGERVVTNGNFKIDSALQIMAKPSMMSPGGEMEMEGHQHD